MKAARKIHLLPDTPGRFLDLQERRRLQSIVESQTVYECDNTEPIAGPSRFAASGFEESRHLDGRRRRRVRTYRASATNVAAWMWRRAAGETDE